MFYEPKNLENDKFKIYVLPMTLCTALNGYLVNIDSAYLNKILWEAVDCVSKGPYLGYWLGLSDTQTPCEFEWSDGRNTSYRNFRSKRINKANYFYCFRRSTACWMCWYLVTNKKF